MPEPHLPTRSQVNPDARSSGAVHSWRTAEQVEAATLRYVHWFNHHRLLEVNGDLPLELEQAYYRLHHSDLAEAG